MGGWDHVRDLTQQCLDFICCVSDSLIYAELFCYLSVLALYFEMFMPGYR